MKRSRVLIVVSVLSGAILLFACMFEFPLWLWRRSDNQLLHADISQVESISIYANFVPKSGKSEWAVLSEEDAADLMEMLNQVELEGKMTPSFRYYDGVQYLMFHVVLKDQTEYDFSASNPFYILDTDRAYKSVYRLCDDISKKYHALLEKYYQEDCPWLKQKE